jgi:hypothetical protein
MRGDESWRGWAKSRSMHIFFLEKEERMGEHGNSKASQPRERGESNDNNGDALPTQYDDMKNTSAWPICSRPKRMNEKKNEKKTDFKP